MKYNFFMPTKLHFGAGKTEEVGEIVSKYGKRCLLVTTENSFPLKGLYDRLKEILEESSVEVLHFDGVKPNPSIEIIESGIGNLKDFKADVILAVGGGSSMDTAKSIGLLSVMDDLNWDKIFNTYNDPFTGYESLSNNPIPVVAIPTTAGTGSEVTQAAVLSMGQDKNTIFHPDNYSNDAILDPELLLTLPKSLTSATGFDCFSHAFESYINPNSSVLSEMMSIEAMTLVLDALPKSVNDLSNITFRESLMHAQTLAGIALANAGAAAPHPLSEIIGGITNIAHGEALALIFPEFVKTHYKKEVKKCATVSRLMNNDLRNVSDVKAAESLENEVKKFLINIDLYKSFDDYKFSDEQKALIINSPILGFLPFGSKEELKGIIVDSINLRE